MSSFQELKLKAQILSALEKKGYTAATPIQESAIPEILAKKDLLGIAQTGTGKTAAFALPVLHNLSEQEITVKRNHVRCLILTPTRELASQIAENVENYGAELSLKHAVIFGGVGENAQIKNLENGQDIVIATPGRLLDLMNQGYVNFAQLEVFILDEADRMLDMGFIRDVQKIIAKLPKERQTLFFSATMPSAISHLAKSILNDPIRIEITPPATTVERIDQKIYLVERSNKAKLLKHILLEDQNHNILVFLRTKHSADHLNDFLQKNGVTVETIHGDKSQSNRELALTNFREGKCRVLIATDIAARGIDIPGITHVINYDIPNDPESYVHRIGRTARAGKDGIAISFCDPTESIALRAIEQTIKYKIPVDETHPFHGADGVTGARKISSANKSENNNLNEVKKMTNQDNKPKVGRRISRAADRKTENKAPAQADASANVSGEMLKSAPKVRTPRKPRPEGARPEGARAGGDRKPQTRNQARPPKKQPEKKGLFAKLFGGIKSIFGADKKDSADKKATPRNGGNSGGNSGGNRNNPNRRGSRGGNRNRTHAGAGARRPSNRKPVNKTAE